MLDQDHTKGTANELYVASYFLEQGCQVYFPAVPQGKTDLVVESNMDGSLCRVQVKTAFLNMSDGRGYVQCRTRTTNKQKTEPKDKYYDYLAIVDGREIWVIPANEIASSNISLRSTAFPEKPYGWDIYKRR